MKTATLIESDVSGFAGEARRYELSEPLGGCNTVVVYVSSLYGNHETVIIGDDNSTSMRPLPGSVKGYTNHEYALFVAGYALEDA